MPTWERFKEVCTLRFGPPVRGTRLSELARLPFTSTVQDYADRFNAMLGHTRKLDAPQKAELFVGGLPDHIRADVAIRDPQDLQSAMYLARAFEQRAAAQPTPPPVRGFRPPRPGLLASPRPPPGPLPAPPARRKTARRVQPHRPRPFRRLTPAEQRERRRQGLSFQL
ncbi:hypothetical protein U9M48_003553 [Paspalum notatum var. saurae]|uniref:Retrotransposon gag domain-containing protein n=1 Tax=Paspalum notatum var. saurae TaxID=547442 RepID=A0AAQ3PIN2_PASNO